MKTGTKKVEFGAITNIGSHAHNIQHKCVITTTSMMVCPTDYQRAKFLSSTINRRIKRKARKRNSRRNGKADGQVKLRARDAQQTGNGTDATKTTNKTRTTRRQDETDGIETAGEQHTTTRDDNGTKAPR